MYEITNIQDVSRPRSKRFIAHIQSHTTSKDLIRKTIQEATEVVKHTSQCSSRTKKKFGDEPAHVVWLYIRGTNGILCRTMWVTDKKTFTVDHPEKPYTVDIRLPKFLDYNDHMGDIGIVWMG
jgi:hypothetical protein